MSQYSSKTGIIQENPRYFDKINTSGLSLDNVTW